jgi:rSAM/selenodomain-associated transferase 1
VERLILFSKAPRLHDVKTRLAPGLAPEQALRLHEAMLEDQMLFLAGFRSDVLEVEVCLDRPIAPARLPLTLQGDGDLGERMARAFSRAFAAGASAAAILGADAPTLPRRLLEDALARVRDDADAAIVPALDGGYVLVAARHPVPSIFRDIPWGTPSVVTATRRRAEETGLLLAETEAWPDVDVAGDLPRLALDLAADPSRAPATAAFLADLGLYAPQNPML